MALINSYQPYTPPQYYMQQPMISQQPQTTGLVWIQGGLNTAKSYHVGPNETVPLWDSEEQVIYLKSADASGMPSIKILDYTIRESQNNQVQNDTQMATKNDLAEIRTEIDKLASRLNQVLSKKDNRKEYNRNE